MTAPALDKLVEAARRSFDEGDLLSAEHRCHEVLARAKRNLEALSLLGRIAESSGLHRRAAEHLARCVAIRPRDTSFLLRLAGARSRQGQFEQAIALFEKVRRREPAHEPARLGLAATYVMQGRYEKARPLLEPLVRGGTDRATAAVLLARLQVNTGDLAAAIETAGSALGRTDVPDEQRRRLLAVLGKAQERSGRFAEAFESYRQAAAVVPVHFDEAKHVAGIDAVIDAFSPERIARLPTSGCDSEVPVFLVGMPRTGSTLIESIIDAHPQGRGLGEDSGLHDLSATLAERIGSPFPWPQCIVQITAEDARELADEHLRHLAAVAPGARRAADKYLQNAVQLGLIAMLLPKARVIHCRRDPLDTCLSCYAETLPPSAHPWASDLRHLGLVHRQVERLMEHWRSVLDLRMLAVDYEALVADQEGQTRRIIEFLGLEWDPACLRFYEEARAVTTLSYDQVRRPIYASSVGRAAPFRPWLTPLMEALDQR